MRLRGTTRSWLILAVECWRPDRGLSGSAYREPWGPQKGAITSSCYQNVRSSWTVPTCDRTWPVSTLICTWIYCTPRPVETSGYVSCWPLLIYVRVTYSRNSILIDLVSCWFGFFDSFIFKQQLGVYLLSKWLREIPKKKMAFLIYFNWASILKKKIIYFLILDWENNLYCT